MAFHRTLSAICTWSTTLCMKHCSSKMPASCFNWRMVQLEAPLSTLLCHTPASIWRPIILWSRSDRNTSLSSAPMMTVTLRWVGFSSKKRKSVNRKPRRFGTKSQQFHNGRLRASKFLYLPSCIPSECAKSHCISGITIYYYGQPGAQSNVDHRPGDKNYYGQRLSWDRNRCYRRYSDSHCSYRLAYWHLFHLQVSQTP